MQPRVELWSNQSSPFPLQFWIYCLWNLALFQNLLMSTTLIWTRNDDNTAYSRPSIDKFWTFTRNVPLVRCQFPRLQNVSLPLPLTKASDGYVVQPTTMTLGILPIFAVLNLLFVKFSSLSKSTDEHSFYLNKERWQHTVFVFKIILLKNQSKKISNSTLFWLGRRCWSYMQVYTVM